MKKVTRIAVIASFATFMFAGMNLTWGNTYWNGADDALTSGSTFGVWFDVNGDTSVGWEGGLKVAFTANNMQWRLGYEDVTTFGVGRTWWNSAGNGWETTLNTTLDFDLVDGTDSEAGDFYIGVNLGFGF